MTDDTQLWRVKLKAWTHDPAEKALVLFHDPAGHTGGTVRELHRALDLVGVPLDKRSDHWAAAADRPQFPRDPAEKYEMWAQVDFAKRPVLIHPISGQAFDLGQLGELAPDLIKAVSLDHLDERVVRNGDAIDARRTYLAFWRFGPDLAAPGLAKLWRLLPADTRVPDHSIFAHLDLTAALAGAFAAGDTPALLAVTFGPVQDFIAQARSTSDFWAGSHLLSRIAWEGMKVIAARFGPDCILYPQLRGVPEVDLWLRDEMSLPKEWFDDTDWMRRQSKANSLFAAALPNRFVAIVPAASAKGLGEEITATVRRFVREQAEEALRRYVLPTIKQPEPYDGLPCFEQLEDQLEAFPEVHWAVVPWSLATEEGETIADSPLQVALGMFYPEAGNAPGFFAKPAYRLLTEPRPEGEFAFFRPNPGMLYPALYDLLDRTLAAAKSLRAFKQLEQEGHRSALGGEREWLTLNRDHLNCNRKERLEKNTLWTRVAEREKRWAAKGEHLDALGMLKRLWPDLQKKRIGAAQGSANIRRYVVSTRTFALAPYLERLAARELKGHGREVDDFVQTVLDLKHDAVLPRKLAKELGNKRDASAKFTRKLGDYLDELSDRAESEVPEEKAAAERDLEKAEASLRKLLGGLTPFPYYAVIRLDGDSMGAWLSGSDEKLLTRYEDGWHPDVSSGAKEQARRFPKLLEYLGAPRAPSPARHMTISEALSAFALRLVPMIVEKCCKGQLIYAGGDDVLAMVAVDDLLPCITLLRLAYSGVLPGGTGDAIWKKHLEGPFGDRLALNNGFILAKDVLYRVMGEKATASVGAVVAHEKEPLARVLREAKAAEKRAKNFPGKNAFSIRILKRSGGPVELTAPWWLTAADGSEPSLVKAPIGRLFALRELFANPAFSRRALYHVLDWLHRLPALGGADEYRKLVEANLCHQMRRQATDNSKAGRQPEDDPKKKTLKQAAEDEAARLVEVAADVAPLLPAEPHRAGTSKPSPPLAKVTESFLATAEFLARPSRAIREADSREAMHLAAAE
jgi:CRISPR-associated protein Cmr2